MSPKHKTAIHNFLWVVTTLFALHGVLLLLQPNGVISNNWLGYSNSRFALLVASFLLAAGTFLIRGQAWVHTALFAAVNSRLGGGLLAIGLLLLSAAVIGSLFLPVDTWGQTIQATLLYLRATLFLVLLVAAGIFILALVLADVPVSEKAFLSFSFALLLVYALLRIYNYLQLGDPYTTADSVAYVGFPSWAEMFALSNLWSGSRPFVVPLLGTLVGRDLAYFVWVQTGISILCWSFLAYSLTAQFRATAMKMVVLVGVLAFSLGRHILVWDWSIMSESLSLSLMTLLLGLFARIFKSFSWGKAALVVLVAFLWAFVRDANAWMVLLVSVVVLLVAIARRLDWKWWALSAALALVFIVNSISVNSAPTPRWAYPLMHAIIVDILPNEDAVGYFVERGMPYSEAMSAWPAAFPTNLNLWQEDDFDEFYRWTNEEGRSVYLSYLLSTAPGSLFKPVAPEYFPVRIGTEFNRPYAYNPPLSMQAEGAFYFGLWSGAAKLVFAMLLLFALWRAWVADNAVAVIALTSVALSYPYAFLAWYGDGLSRARHILPAEVLLRFGCLLLVLVLAGYITERLFPRKATWLA